MQSSGSCCRAAAAAGGHSGARLIDGCKLVRWWHAAVILLLLAISHQPYETADFERCAAPARPHVRRRSAHDNLTDRFARKRSAAHAMSSLGSGSDAGLTDAHAGATHLATKTRATPCAMVECSTSACVLATAQASVTRHASASVGLRCVGSRPSVQKQGSACPPAQILHT
jgi:hypothetical protein